MPRALYVLHVVNVYYCIANVKLSEMNSELSRAQEHAYRFQDLLATERRKQKALQVRIMQRTMSRD